MNCVAVLFTRVILSTCQNVPFDFVYTIKMKKENIWKWSIIGPFSGKYTSDQWIPLPKGQ